MDQQPNYVPPPNSSPQSTTDIPQRGGRKFPVVQILITVLIFALLASLVWAGLLVRSSQQKSRELSTLTAKLADTEKQIEDLNWEIAEQKATIYDLDNPQKRERDVQRRKDLQTVVIALRSYASNRNGRLPSAESTSFAKDFVQPEIRLRYPNFNDPGTGEPYSFRPVGAVQTPPGVTLGTIQYQLMGRCAGGEFIDTESTRQAAVRTILETGDIYCLDV